jgi:uncharacterized protein (TIGR00730 family)
LDKKAAGGIKMDLKSIGVFLGSNYGGNAAYKEDAILLGKILAREGIKLVYGGGGRGLMGELAIAVKENGGRVTGVSPERFHGKSKDFKIDEYILVKTMHERKNTMYDLSQAFIILPGGIGTLEEFAEIFTWLQLGFHDKPVALLNTSGFYDPLIQLLDRFVETGFLTQSLRDLLIIETDPGIIIERIRRHQRPVTPD